MKKTRNFGIYIVGIVIILIGVLAVGFFLKESRTNNPGGTENPALPKSDLLNVKYASGNEAQTLDLYVPENGESKTFVVLIHGGGWKEGDKSGERELAKWFASKGYPIVSVNYRLAPESTFPAQPEDVLTALNFIEKNYGADKFILYGHSAGAQLAMLIALAQNNQNAFRDKYPNGKIIATIGTSGPYDYHLLKGNRLVLYQNFAGNKMDEANVIDYADQNDKLDVLILAGADDNFVPWENSKELSEKLPNDEYFLLNGYSHNDIIQPFNENKEAVKKIAEFLGKLE